MLKECQPARPNADMVKLFAYATLRDGMQADHQSADLVSAKTSNIDTNKDLSAHHRQAGRHHEKVLPGLGHHAAGALGPPAVTPCVAEKARAESDCWLATGGNGAAWPPLSGRPYSGCLE